MRKNVFKIACVIILLNVILFSNSCRKLELVDVSLAAYSDDNANNPVVAPCAPSDSIVTLGNMFPYQLKIKHVYSHATSSTYEITGEATDGSNVVITLGGDEKPAKDKEFNILNEDPYYNTSNAKVQIRTYYGYEYNAYSASSGKLYVNIVNGKTVISFCSLTFTDGPTTFISSGKIIF